MAGIKHYIQEDGKQIKKINGVGMCKGNFTPVDNNKRQTKE